MGDLLDSLGKSLEGVKPYRPLQPREKLTGGQKALAAVHAPMQTFTEGVIGGVAAIPEAFGQVQEMTGLGTGANMRGLAAGMREYVAMDERMKIDGVNMHEQGFGSEVAGAMGQAAVFIVGGAAAKGVGLGVKGTAHVIGALGSTQQAQAMYLEAEASGADDDTKMYAFMFGAAIGQFERVGNMEALGLGGRLAQIDKRSGGQVTEIIQRSIKAGLQGAAGEGLEEGLQTTAEKLVAQKVLEYADEQDLAAFASDVGRATSIGAIVGQALSGTVQLSEDRATLNPKKEKPLVNESLGGEVDSSTTKKAKPLDPAKLAEGSANLESALDAEAAPTAEAKTSTQAAEKLKEANKVPDAKVRILGEEQGGVEVSEEEQALGELVTLLRQSAGKDSPMPEIALVDAGQKLEKQGVVIGGAMALDASRMKENLQRVLVHELQHLSAPVGSDAFKSTVRLAQQHFPALAQAKLDRYVANFPKGQTPFPGVPEGPQRTAMLMDEAFAQGAEDFQPLVVEMLKDPGFLASTEAPGTLRAIWEWLVAVLRRTPRGSRAQLAVNKFIKDGNLPEGAKPEEVLAFASAIAEAIKNPTPAEFKAAAAKVTVEDVLSGGFDSQADLDLALAESVDVEGIAKEVTAEASRETAKKKQPEGESAEKAATAASASPLTPAQEKRAKKKRERARNKADAARAEGDEAAAVETERKASKPPRPAQTRSPRGMTAMEAAMEAGEVDEYRFSVAPREDSPAFKKWFSWNHITNEPGDGQSAVSHPDGRPLVVYHGSPDARFVEDTGVFMSLAERFGQQSADGPVHWFASSRRTAETYADDTRAFDYQNAEPGVVAVYLSIQNPLIVEGRGRKWRDAQRRGKTSDVIEQAIKDGHDGIIIRNVQDDYNNLGSTTATDTYAVFSPTQIKSVHNRGTWDGTNPDIRFSVAPQWDTPEWKKMVAGMHPDLKDADGNPQVFYHGTAAPEDFAEFSQDFNEIDDVTYFTSDPSEASYYATSSDASAVEKDASRMSNPRIIPVYLAGTVPEAQKGAMRGQGPKRTGAAPDFSMTVLPDGTKVVAMWKPELIKSIWNRRPTASPDIRYSVAGDDQVKKEGFPVAVAGKAKNAAMRFWQKHLRSRGDLPQSSFDAMIKRDGRVRFIQQKIVEAHQDFKKAAKEAYKGRELTQGQHAVIDEAFRDDTAVNSLPKPLQAPVRALRTHVKEMSMEMIRVGAVEGDMVATVLANLDVYAFRSYQAFDDPKWAEKVPLEIRNKAKAYLRQKAGVVIVPAGTSRKDLQGIAKRHGVDASQSSEEITAQLAVPRMTEENIEGEIEGILYEAKLSQSPMAMFAKGKLGSKDLSMFIKRKRIAPEIRALLGEYKEPMVNYSRSVSKMGFVIANHQFLTSVRKSGLEEGYFRDPEKGRTPKNFVKIAADESHAMAPLNGLYTSPEVLQAFEDINKTEPAPWYIRHWMKANGTSKIAMTAMSFQTHARNTFGGYGFILAQGHPIPRNVKQAFAGFGVSVGWNKNTEAREFFKKALKFAVVHESANAGETYDIVQDAWGKDPNDVLAQQLSRNPLKKAAGAILKTYQAEDDFWKLMAWGMEAKSYRKAYPEWTEDQVLERAAQVVRATNPTYSLIPNAAKMARRFPVTGAFISFPSEVIRITWNTAHLIKAERADPKTRAIGNRRLAGAMTAALLPTAAGMATAALLGYSDDEEEAMRELAPSWSRNSDWFFLNRDEEGRPRYINMGYTDPFSYVKGPIRALLQGDSIPDAVGDMTMEFAEPFVGEEILFGAVREVMSNKTQTGGTVYNEAVPKWQQGAEISEYLWYKAFEPRTITSLRRIKKAATEEVSPWGQSYDLSDETIAMLAGQRRSTIDVGQALSFRARDFSTDTAQANKILSSVASRSGSIDESRIRSAYVGMEAARKRVFDDLARAVSAARTLGETDEAIEGRLRGAGMSKAASSAVVDGVYEPYKPTAQFLKFYEKGASAERKAELQARRKLVQSIANEPQ